MRYTSLHKIVTGYLLKRRYPIHFYIEFLTHCAAGLTELHFDTLQNVETKLLPINNYGAITVPCDFLDWVKVGVPNGQYVRPLANRPGLSRLNNFDSSGNIIAFDADNILGDHSLGVNVNEKYENTGRRYGARSNGNNTFIYVKERGEIQLNINIKATNIVLEYISDGSEPNNATKVNPYAITTLESYMNWQNKENSRTVGAGEKQRARSQYDHEHRLLRSRLNPLTKADVNYIFNSNTHGSVK